MPLDSRDKRFSMVAYDHVVGHVYPTPDGAVSTADRIQWIGKYRGIAFRIPSTANLNSAAKRFCMINYDLLGFRVLPRPDGTLSASDRVSLIGKYCGIAFTSVTVATSVFIPVIRRRRR